MLGKSITIHQDGIASAHLLYQPEVTEDLRLSVNWYRDSAVLDLDVDEMELLAKRLKKAVKKMRKHRAKLAKQGRIHTDPVQEYVKHGRRR